MINVTFTTKEIISLLVTLTQKEHRSEFEENCKDKLLSAMEKATNENGLWFVVNKAAPNSKSRRSESIFKLRKFLKDEIGSDLKAIKNFIDANENFQYGLSPALVYDKALKFYHILKDLDFVCELKKNTEFEINDNYRFWEQEKVPF